jgi:hypothetical protein
LYPQVRCCDTIPDGNKKNKDTELTPEEVAQVRAFLNKENEREKRTITSAMKNFVNWLITIGLNPIAEKITLIVWDKIKGYIFLF